MIFQLGIRELFEDNANLSSAFPRGNVKVGGVIHNAQIDVNEEGTVASAVTGNFSINSVRREYKLISAGHPPWLGFGKIQIFAEENFKTLIEKYCFFTGVSVIPLIGSSNTVFRADRPFIFFILDNATDAILFAGRYVQPEQAVQAPAPEAYRNSYINPIKFKTG